MEKLNLSHRFFETGDDIADAYPALEGCRGKPYSGVYEDTAGHIRASKACQAMVRAARDKCEVRLDNRIISLDADDEGGKVTAVTENGETITADNAVIACGPWTNKRLEAANLPKLNLDVWQIQ